MTEAMSRKQRREAIFKRFEEKAKQSQVATEFKIKKQNVAKLHAKWKESQPAPTHAIVQQMTDREKRVVAIFCWERRDKTGDTQETIAKSLEMKQQHVGRIISNWRERGDTEDRRKGNQRP